MCTSVTSLRVISLAPTVIPSMIAHVVTIVLLSSRNPYRQKTSSSGVRRNGCLLFQFSLLYRRLSCEPLHDDQARHHKSNETRHKPRPVTLRNKIESG